MRLTQIYTDTQGLCCLRSERHCARVGVYLSTTGLIVIFETSVEKAMQRWSTESAELVIDIDETRRDPLELCRNFCEVSAASLLLFLPPAPWVTGYFGTPALRIISLLWLQPMPSLKVVIEPVSLIS